MGAAVDDVGQLGTRNLLLVGHGTHDRANRETVEVVIDEDEHAKGEGGELRADARLDVLGRPGAESRRAARFVDERNHDAEHHEEDEDTRVPRVTYGVEEADRHGVLPFADLADDDVVDGVNRVEARKQQRAHDNADEQRRIGFLGNERQYDGDDGRHERPEGSDKLHDLPNACQRDNRAYYRHLCAKFAAQSP